MVTRFLSPLILVVLLANHAHSHTLRHAPLTQHMKLSTRQANTGVTYDSCKTDEDCAGNRNCVNPADENDDVCDSADNCLCLPDEFVYCSKSEDCEEEKEVCITDSISPATCGSSDFVSPPTSNTIENAKENTAKMCKKKEAKSSATLLSGDECKSDDPSSCPAGMSCLDLSATPFGCCNSDSENCVCLRLEQAKCDNSGDCPNGEVCARIQRGPSHCFKEGFLLDRFAAEQFEVLPVCVQETALRHLTRDELVFAEHRRAPVLCNMDGSCATAGHIVVWKDKAMTMASYCREEGDRAKCVRRVILVNSPKYRRKLRVKTRTEGLEFTALAARYGTKVEETILAAAVHMDL